ncbi:MAG: aminodeoxychorismate/anthranilate synthase component II [Succinivibrionaceae bacterium]|jgi:anthranilate synthase/aminodeoxychorismate synthase-like glutamine amidotransferase|nr:aminodeoxychorismate/anthranilate synthase component II [Succinivibrionaceae bacterium]
MNKMVFLLDNYDSFTYNLVDQFRSMSLPVKIYRNSIDAKTIFEEMKKCTAKPVLVLSPGPGTPSEAGCMKELIDLCHGKFPILGICLGHQAICEYYGGTVDRAGEIVHGKISLISHTEHPIFRDLPNPMPVARYHSLVATSVPECLEVIADCKGLVMSLLHKTDRVLGFQFHPESIMTADGARLLTQSLNFITGED